MSRIALIILLFSSNLAAAQAPGTVQKLAPPSSAVGSPQPYVLDDTEVRAIRATHLQRDYQLFASLPASYQTHPERTYPVLFVTDANYAFPLIRSITNRVGDHGTALKEFILIGLSYADGDTPRFSRNRDYTPTPNGKDSSSDMPGRAQPYGESADYQRFLADEVFPFVAKTWRVDPQHKTFVGHSYGALLGLQILLTEPSMFENYILGSPSLWFDHKLMFARENAYAKAHHDLPAHLFMAVGAFETIGADPHDARYNRTEDMVADVRAFERSLKSRAYPHLTIESRVIADEDHLTVFPALITRGLKWAYPAERHQTDNVFAPIDSSHKFPDQLPAPPPARKR